MGGGVWCLCGRLYSHALWYPHFFLQNIRDWRLTMNQQNDRPGTPAMSKLVSTHMWWKWIRMGWKAIKLRVKGYKTVIFFGSSFFTITLPFASSLHHCSAHFVRYWFLSKFWCARLATLSTHVWWRIHTSTHMHVCTSRHKSHTHPLSAMPSGSLGSSGYSYALNIGG